MAQDSKKNDLLLNMLANPSYTMTDFIDVGINADNSTIKSRYEYLNNEKIRRDPTFAKSDGTFDENKFNKFYDAVVSQYNVMANKSYDEMLVDEIETDPYDILSDPSTRRYKLEDQVKLVEFGKDIPMLNPNRTKFSVGGVGKMSEGAWTPQELAQMSERYNPETGKFEESPENWFTGDHWYSNIFKTTVMATYSEDDPEVQRGERKAGEYKLNDQGTYYTEFLNGRTTYNREIVSKLDLLTKEGSWINRYDFFDSDDKDKNVFGSIMRNVAAIAPMFIPYVGQYYILGSIAMQTGGIATTVAKMAWGSDNDLVNDADGFFSQFQGGTSQYSKEHTFTAENLVNMFGQVVSQIKEQRWIFKDARKMFTGRDIMGDASEIKKMQESFTKANFEKYTEKLKNGDNSIKEMFLNLARGDKDKLFDIVKAYSSTEARIAVEAAQKNAMKYSELISQIYMTGVTTADTYNQIKAEGGSDMQALALTLGYSMAEFGLLKTDIGKWILPETRLDAQKLKQTIDILGKAEDAAIMAGTRAARNGFMQKAISMGRDLYKSIPYGGTKAVIGGALSEGVEETSEELLADIVKVAGNAYNWLVGDDLRYQTFDNMAERYGMSLLGGLAGGGFTTATGLFKDMDNGALEGIKTKDQAMEYLAYTLRNNGISKVLKAIDKAKWGNPNLSTEEVGIVEDEDFGLKFSPGTSIDNQDKAMKDVMKKIIIMYNDLLSNNGLNVNDDESVRKALLNNTLYSLVSKSITASSYVSDFNSAIKDFVKAKMDYDAVKKRIYDSNKNGNIEDKENRRNEPDNNVDIKALNDAEQNMIMKRENAQAYINGKNTGNLILKAIFELNPELSGSFKSASLESYISSKYGVDIDTLTDERLLEYTKEYNEFIESSGKDYLNEAFLIFSNMMSKMNPYLTSGTEAYYDKINMDKNALKILESGMNRAKVMLDNVNSGTPDFQLFSHLSNLSSNKPDTLNESANTVSGIDENRIIGLALSKYKIDNNILSLEDYAESKMQAPEGTDNNDGILRKWKENDSNGFQGYIRNSIKSVASRYLMEANKLASSLMGSKYVDATVKRSLVDTYKRLYDYAVNVDRNKLIAAAKILRRIHEGIDPNTEMSFEEALNYNPLREFINNRRVNGEFELQNLELTAGSNLEEDDIDILENIDIQYDAIETNKGNMLSELDKMVTHIASLPSTPVMEMIDKMGFNKDGRSAVDVYNEIVDVFQSKSGDMKSFTLTSEQGKNIKRLAKYSVFITSILDATRDDNRSIINPVSFIDTAKKYASTDPSSIWKNMNTISGDIAKKMKYEVERINSQLDFYLKISRLNDGNNTREVKKLETNLNILKYKALNELASKMANISTEDKKRLNNALSDPGFDIAKKIDENRDSMDLNIPEDQLKDMYAAIDRAEQVVYDIFENDKSLLEKDSLKPYISSSIDNVMENTAIDSASVNFSPIQRAWYIASVIAMNPHLKHSMTSQVYANKDLMPNALQMHSAEMAVSFIANRDVFHKFSIMIKSAVDDNFGKMMEGDDDSRYDRIFEKLEKIGVYVGNKVKDKLKNSGKIDEAIKFYYQNSQIYNIFDNIMFIEGVPGSGKTSAVLNKLISRMIQAKDNNGNNYIQDIDELASNVYFITTSGMKESIKESSKNIFGSNKDAKVLTHEEFLQEAFGISKDKVDEEFRNKAMVGGNGDSSVDYVVRYTGKHNYGDTVRKPSIILIDETTLYNQQQMEAINAMSKDLNIPVVVFGDTSQIQNATQFTPEVNNSLSNFPKDIVFEDKFSFQVFSGQFVSSPKIGFFMRPNNSHITTTMNNFRVNMENNLNGKGENTIYTHYYYGDEGLFGVKVTDVEEGYNVGANDKEDIEIIKSMIDNINKTLETMKATTTNPEYEKIGYVGKRQFLEDLCDKVGIDKNDIDKYFDIFNEPVNTIGMERKFYIINSPESNWSQSDDMGRKYDAYHNLYTAMSRIKQGALVFHSSGGVVKSSRDNVLSLTRINRDDIEKYSENFAKMYSEALGDNVFTIDPIKIFKEKENTDEDKDKDNGEGDMPTDALKDRIQDNPPTKKVNKEISEKESPVDSDGKRKKGDEGFKSLIGYTFNMFEVGKGFKVDDEYIYFDENSFDGMNGLFRLALYFNEDLRKKVEDSDGNIKKINIGIFNNGSSGNMKENIEKMMIEYTNRMHFALTSGIFNANGKTTDPVDNLMSVVSDFLKRFGVQKTKEELTNMLITNDNLNGSSLYYHKLSVSKDNGRDVEPRSDFWSINNKGNTRTLNVNYYDGKSKTPLVDSEYNIRARLSYIAKFKIGNKYIPLEVYLSSIEDFITFMLSVNRTYNLGIQESRIKEYNIKGSKEDKEFKEHRNKIVEDIKAKIDGLDENTINSNDKTKIKDKLDALNKLYQNGSHTVINLAVDENDKYGTGLLTDMIIKGPTLVLDEKMANSDYNMQYTPSQTNLNDFESMSGMSISSPMVAVKGGDDSINEVINKGYMKRGYPFVIVYEGLDGGNMPDSSMLSGYVKQCLDEDTNKKVKKFKLVYVNMPSFNINDYLGKIASMINDKTVDINGNNVSKNSMKFIGDVFTSLNLITRFLGLKLDSLKPISREDFINNHEKIMSSQLGIAFDMKGNNTSAEKMLGLIYDALYEQQSDNSKTVNSPMPLSKIANNAFNGGNNIINYILMAMSGYSSFDIGKNELSILASPDFQNNQKLKYANDNFIKIITDNGFDVVYASARAGSGTDSKVIDGVSLIDTNGSSVKGMVKIGEELYPITVFGKILPSTIYVDIIETIKGRIDNNDNMLILNKNLFAKPGEQLNTDQHENSNMSTINIKETVYNGFDSSEGNKVTETTIEFEKGKLSDKLKELSNKYRSGNAKKIPVFYIENNNFEDYIGVFYANNNTANTKALRNFYSMKGEYVFVNDNKEMTVKYTEDGNGRPSISINDVIENASTDIEKKVDISYLKDKKNLLEEILKFNIESNLNPKARSTLRKIFNGFRKILANLNSESTDENIIKEEVRSIKKAISTYEKLNNIEDSHEILFGPLKNDQEQLINNDQKQLIKDIIAKFDENNSNESRNCK